MDESEYPARMEIKDYGIDVIEWEDDSKVNLMSYGIDENGKIHQTWIAAKCPFFLTHEQRYTYDDETLDYLEKKHKYLYVEHPKYAD